MKTILLFIAGFSITAIVNGQNRFFDTTLSHSKTKISVQIKSLNKDYILLTITNNSKVLISDTLSTAASNPEFIDFNKDSNQDIMFSFIGNNATYRLYLFDTKNKTFKNVKGFDKFPYAVQLKSNPKFYYSYHRAGCADMNWVSDLFTIENFSTVHKGHIYGQGCDYEIETYPQKIEIYKILNNNKDNTKVFEKLDYSKHIAEFGEKWDFIKSYWNKNYSKFK